MDKTTQLSDSETKEPIYFYPKVVVDLGIKEFKRRLVARKTPKSIINKMVRDFKQKEWEMYHETFPFDNSSVPTHKHLTN